MTASQKPPAKSAREQFNGLDEFYEQQREARRQQLNEEMSNNMSRIAASLPRIVEDEMRFRKQRSQIDTTKLRENFYGGGELKRIRNIRIGVNVFQAVVSPYNQEQIESMQGFKELARACASPDIDMNLRVYYDSSWASTMFEIQFDVPFAKNGRYKDMIADDAKLVKDMQAALPSMVDDMKRTQENSRQPEKEKPAKPATREMKRKPTHPGELLAKDILPALGLDAKTFAAKLGVPTRTLNAVLKEKAPVTPDLAKKLSKVFGNSAQFWINMQNGHDGKKQPAKPATKKLAPKR